MHIEDFRDHCLGLPGATEETPFGPETLVFKVGGKIFALTDIDTFASVNLKCDPARALELREAFDFVRPGFHMNKKHWNTVLVGPGAADAQLRAWTADSYDLVAATLPKTARAELARALEE
ncbi:MmcQ/YjbR family DNA-binding protein [Hymenobacter caeli]|uniref:DNA-binding protein (MmcQ/YjbR family) n=1 Tax=Hymenobacter caeli TaxID=2735894 RepID=A0ABX2FMI0_9BACT|nr:MmcQ/YjbR family DNA-binding protein [Hymenobacter caeli]NRT17672.1 putative DNA-binding protein (MmcQ/YjbR family) [Hymenobacter caeli]